MASVVPAALDSERSTLKVPCGTATPSPPNPSLGSRQRELEPRVRYPFTTKLEPSIDTPAVD